MIIISAKSIEMSPLSVIFVGMTSRRRDSSRVGKPSRNDKPNRNWVRCVRFSVWRGYQEHAKAYTTNQASLVGMTSQVGMTAWFGKNLTCQLGRHIQKHSGFGIRDSEFGARKGFSRSHVLWFSRTNVRDGAGKIAWL